MLSPAQGLHAWMALPVRAMTFFLALALLLLAQGQMHHGPVTPWVHKEAGKSGLQNGFAAPLPAYLLHGITLLSP